MNGWHEMVKESDGRDLKSAEPGLPDLPVMVMVEGGSFVMGDGSDVTNAPVNVRLDGFRISDSAVTQALYEAVMGKNPSRIPDEGAPVDSVTWYDAVEFCNALSSLQGLEECYSIDKSNPDRFNLDRMDLLKWTVRCDFTRNGYRLPTEAEWEYAAMSGGKAKAGKRLRYSGSDDLDLVGWSRSNSFGCSHTVRTKRPNGLGIYDMSGNAREWCWDWFGPSLAPGTNPTGPESGRRRVMRGGSWSSFERACSVCNRGSFNPSRSSEDMGFRVVCSVSE